MADNTQSASSSADAALPLALTMGDPCGVGGELTLTAWRTLKASGPAFFIIDDPERLSRLGADIAVISQPQEAATIFANALPVLSINTPVAASPGVSTPHNAQAVIESIDRAVAFTLAGAAGAVVTNPIQKSSLMAAGFSFPGHTEYLEKLTENAPMPARRKRGAVMMLAGPQLRTVPVTVHVSVKEAVQALRPDLIVRSACIVEEALRQDFGIAAPRLVISGLNPHAGENGALGVEDAMIIAPAVDELNAMGLNTRGPLPADTLFHAEARATYDAAICMLHDQALIAAKTLAFHEAVNVTLGLPIIRTSPDHGTALDIAGTGKARADSLVAAIKLAATMASRRRSRQ
ncbi:MAG: 4-hydroxythreonine-4-phosphate dehydrogenase PdxA [Hyphococcus sp.]